MSGDIRIMELGGSRSILSRDKGSYNSVVWGEGGTAGLSAL